MIKKEIFNGVLQIQPVAYEDERGSFTEIYNKKEFEKLGINNNFVQDNISFSKKRGTLRGLHFQLDPYEQSKLIKVIKGNILDVFVDIRPDSNSFGEYSSIKISEDSGWIYIPKGFAHGFITLEDNTTVMYKVDEFYSTDHECGIIWNDSVLQIDWKFTENIILSEKDRKLSKWDELFAQ
tara:strand:+ start:2244 stop:2783 length:540 start_codon:yes stop_codon:yes gene_type:complete